MLLSVNFWYQQKITLVLVLCWTTWTWAGDYEAEGRSFPGTDVCVRIDTAVKNGKFDFLVVQKRNGRVGKENLSVTARTKVVVEATLTVDGETESLLGSGLLVLIVDGRIKFKGINPYGVEEWKTIYNNDRVDQALEERLVKDGYLDTEKLEDL